MCVGSPPRIVTVADDLAVTVRFADDRAPVVQNPDDLPGMSIVLDADLLRVRAWPMESRGESEQSVGLIN